MIQIDMIKPNCCGKCPMQDLKNGICRLRGDEYESWEEEFEHCPIVPAEDKGGKQLNGWRRIKDIPEDLFECPNCYMTQTYGDTPFCPFCGARVRETTDEEKDTMEWVATKLLENGKA